MTDENRTGSVPERYEDYASNGSEPRFTDWLRARSEPAWSEATDGRFVRELRTGEIDPAVFRRYLIQDYAFVADLVSVIGHAIGDAPTLAAKRRLIEFAETITNEEDDYFGRSFDALDVPEADRRDPVRVESTRAFADLLGRAGHEGGYVESLAVFVPAEWVYLTWAERVEELPEAFYLREWVELHRGPAFESFVEWLRGELDREGPRVSPRRQRRLERLFGRCVTLEQAFFEAAYGTGTRE